MKQTKLLRIVSFVLAFIMLLEIVPMQVYATEADTPDESVSIPMPEATIQETVEKIPEVYIEGEVTQLRNEFEKHYRLTDGSFMAVQYQVPVHYEDDGQWVDIDNTLEAVTMFNGDSVYQAVNGENVQAFAADLDDGTIMTMANGDYVVSMSIWTSDPVEEEVEVIADAREESVSTENIAADTEPTATEEPVGEESAVDTEELGIEETVKVTEESVPEDSGTEEVEDTAAEAGAEANTEFIPDVEEANSLQDASNEIQQDDTIAAQILTEDVAEETVADTEETEQWELDDVTPDALSSSILYEDVFPGVDLRYDTFSYNVKESIILKQQMDLDEYSYSFLLTLDDLEPELQEDGSILLLDDTDKVRYTIPAPYMWDAENEYSDAVNYELEENSDGWVLTVCADEIWLEDESRVYPVTIDPSIELNNDNMLFTSAVEMGNPTSSTYLVRHGNASIGVYETYGDIEGYIKIQNLPQLPAGSVVTEAKLSPGELARYHISVDFRVDISILTSGLNDSEWSGVVPWSSRPEREAVPMDFAMVSYSVVDFISPKSWDITPAVMKWYDDPSHNYGLSLTATLTAAHDSSCVRLDPEKVELSIIYRNAVGTENYYTYETQSAVRAGTGYVGDYSSALTIFKNDVSYSSATIPLNIGHVYNSSLGEKELSSYDASKDTFVPDYSKMLTGYGWQLSVQESVKQTEINDDRYLVYRDGDGTLHYFKNSSGNTYEDEDGLGLKITQDTAGLDISYTMKDQSGNERYFRNGYLNYIKDANGNQICFLYNGDEYKADHSAWYPPATGAQLTSIVAVNNDQSAQTICTFEYKENHLLHKIIDYANRTTVFGYSSEEGGYLLDITHPDSTTVHYRYDSGKLTRMFDAEAGYGIEYGFDESGVIGFHEYTSNAVDGDQNVGTSVKRQKNGNQETMYRYNGDDRVFHTDTFTSKDDIVNCCYFDYSGRTINAVTLNYDTSKTLGVTAAAYTATSKETPAKNNRITKTGQSGQNGVNLLKNTGLEYANGTSNNPDWGFLTEANCSGTISDAVVRTGLKALKTSINSAASTNETQLTGMYQTVSLAAGTTYTFSAYVNTNGVINFPDGRVYAAFLDEDNSILESGDAITYITNEEIEDGWQRIYCTYTPKNSLSNCRVAVIQEDALGEVYYDDLQLEVGDAPSTVNLLQNATFDNTNYWDLGEYSYSENVGDPLHPNVMTVEGDPTDYLRAKQHIEINQVCTDQTFLLSGWGKAASAANCETAFSWLYGDSIYEDHDSRYFGLIARAWYKASDGMEHAEYFYMPFNDDYDDWQFAACVVVPGSYMQNMKMVLKYIDVYVVYGNNFNTMYVDNLSLRQEPCTTYTYNALGNVTNVGATGSEGQAVLYISESDPRPDTIWKSEDEVYFYQYLDTRNKYLPTYISNDLADTYTYYRYDEFGNNDKTEIGELTEDDVPSSYPKLTSSATYYDDGFQLKSETNVNGQTSTYTYTNTRMVKDVIKENGDEDVKVTSTYYSGTDRVKQSYISNVVSAKNTYTKGLLNTIERGGYYTEGDVKSAKQNQYYNLTYDTFGNMKAVSVGADPENAITLATYSYGNQNNHLNAMTYGNNHSITYTYDDLDRMTLETWSDGTAYQYLYNSEGALAKKIDVTDQDKVDNGTADAVNYEYDSLGRLIHSSVTDSEGFSMLTEHMYDRQNRISQQSYQLRNSDNTFKTYSLEYTYRSYDGSLTRVATTDNYIDAYNLTYDELARLSTRANSFCTQTYAYRTSGDTTTTQIESIDYDAGTYATDFEEFSLTYGYDALGNIETITGTGISGQNAVYDYDIQGQLTSAVIDGKNYTYEYDTYGNIREAVEDGVTHEYEYGNSDWLDLLTTYDGETITYDEIGNPESYYNGTRWAFDWAKGRQLVSASGGGKSISYTYDMAGIRNSKTVGDITYHYDTLNGKVVRQTWTENGKEHVFDIVYDARGLPYACVYNGSRYYYVLNQQGDVIRIVGYLGATLCEYQYDAWGNVLAITGTYRNTIGKINPIRYRGYYYDTETGFYYLQSRYYDPSIGRFINADAYVSTGQGFLGYNMFAYCLNNLVNYSDSFGNRPDSITDQVTAICFESFGLQGTALSQLQSEAGNFSPAIEMMYDSVVDSYNSERVQGLVSASKIARGAKKIHNGIIGIVIPDVMVSKVYGVYQFSHGLIMVLQGIIDVIDNLFDVD